MELCSARELAAKARAICRRTGGRYPDVTIGDLPWGVVNGWPCLFYPRALRNAHPEVVADLIAEADLDGFMAMVDRRERSVPVETERRRRLAVVIGLSATLLARVPSLAAGGLGLSPPLPATVTEAALAAEPPAAAQGNLVALRAPDGAVSLSTRHLSASRIAEHLSGLSECDTKVPAVPCIEADAAHAAAIAAFFHARLPAAERRPAIIEALNEVARYYSQFPAVRRVISKLEPFEVALIPAERRWETRAELAGDRVNAVQVYFDLRVAAQMHFHRGCEDQPACTASPADAFLHELVHAYLMFYQGRAFAESVRATGYPHAHEREVIALERRIYAQMSRSDGLPRPSRFRHLAELVAVDCPVCWAAR